MTESQAKNNYFGKLVRISFGSANPARRQIHAYQGVKSHLMWWRCTSVVKEDDKVVLTLLPVYFLGKAETLNVSPDEIVEVRTDIDNEHAILAHVRKHIWEYFEALDNRQHGGVAADKCLNGIVQLLGMHWEQGCTKNQQKS